MTEAVATIKGQKLDSRYTLIDKLGAGGQGEVWRAHDGTRGIDVALKVVRPGDHQEEEEAWSALEHEHAIASRLDHPSILKVFPPYRTGDTMVLPMELASGGDLRRLRGGGFLEIIPILLEIAQALEHAHERSVVHRDLKPGNVLFDARGRARLADFGVAETAASSKELSSAASPSSTNRDTNRHGFSPFTASPAQLRGEPPTPADDIYGLGALAYELLSGYPPYYPHFDRKRAIEEPVPELVPTRQIPPLLRSLVMRLLAKDPKQRPRTMREVIDELDAALNDTLTFDFENVSRTPAASGPSGVASAPLPSFFASPSSTDSATPGPRRTPRSASPSPPSAASLEDNHTIYLPMSETEAANTSDERPKPFDWSPTSGPERRSVPDRRAKPRDGSLAPRIREPTYASDLSGAGSNDTIAWPGPGADADSTSRSPGSASSRPGSDALARIDAALERAAAMAAAAPSASSTTTHFTAPQSPEARVTSPQRSSRVAEPRSAKAQSELAHPTQARSADPAPVSTRQGLKTPTSVPQGLKLQAPAPQAPAHQAPASHGSMYQSPMGHVAPSKPAPPPSASHTATPAMPPLAASPHHPGSMHTNRVHPTWERIPIDGLPRVARLEPIKSRRWPWVVLGLLAGGAAAVYFLLPRFDLQTLSPEVSAVIAPIQSALTPDKPSPGANPQKTVSADSTASTSQSQAAAVPATAPDAGAVTSTTPTSDAEEEQRLQATRQAFDSRLAALEARGAGVWGGREFSMAKTRAAESVGARDAGNARMAQERLAAAMKLLDNVESKAPQALQAQVAAGEKALGSGQQEVAGQAFDLARRIDPSDRRATDGQRRAQSLNGVLPLLADAQNAEGAHDYARAAQDYSQALSIDPGNVAAKTGQARANAAFGDDNYAKAVGSGFAALGAGRLDEARASFVKARALKPNGAEASDGLRRVQAAQNSRGFASLRQRAENLEAQERWDDAQQEYEDALRADPSLAFAQQGKARAASRADLGIRLQQLIDRPDRLSSPGVREDARALLETAKAQTPSGPVLNSQIARLQQLLPGFDRPVRLSLVSDNSTQVAISSVGSFGSFSRRDIELRPGRYIVVGTRNGFRDVRREITVAPGQDIQTIKVTCSEPI